MVLRLNATSISTVKLIIGVVLIVTGANEVTISEVDRSNRIRVDLDLRRSHALVAIASGEVSGDLPGLHFEALRLRRASPSSLKILVGQSHTEAVDPD
jgi:hypothetical protein